MSDVNKHAVELLPCPFCRAELQDYPEMPSYYLHPDNDCYLSRGLTRKDHVAIWNTRATDLLKQNPASLNTNQRAKDCAKEISSQAFDVRSFMLNVGALVLVLEKHITAATAPLEQRVKELEAMLKEAQKESKEWASRAGRADGELHEIYETMREAALLKEGKS